MIDESASLPELAAVVARAAMRSDSTICTAESCTGGMIAHLLTGVAGVSQVYQGTVVAYSNVAKLELLGVPPAVLAANGAVSEPVARAMARGACERFHAALGVSTTGVAGPGGGSPAKPVGLVYVALLGLGRDEVDVLQLSGDREAIIRAATRHALRMLEEALAPRMH
jgi:PncC family amidohydrolase